MKTFMFRLPFPISYLDDTNFTHRGHNLEMDRYQRVEKPKADTPITKGCTTISPMPKNQVK